jgi:hypothetical protein
MLWAVGLADKLTLDTGRLTVRLTVMGAIVTPEAVPAIVRVLVPLGVLAVVVIVSLALVPVAGSGLKAAVAPEGRSLTVSFTAPGKLVRLRLMV